MRLLFEIVFALLVVQRLHELHVARRHESALRARGAHEAGAAHYPWMVATHAAWLAAWAVEATIFGVQAWWGSVPFAALSLIAEALRAWTIRTLGDRWTTRVLVLPHEPPVTAGPYRWVRHPNYAAVFVLLVSLPLVFGAWRTAVFGAIAYGIVLWIRVRVEHAAWATRAARAPVARAIRPHETTAIDAGKRL